VFINFGDNSSLDTIRFAPFGEVTSGMDVVDKLYSGYGEGPPQGAGPDQDKVTNQGRAYLEKNFPKLDTIKTTTLIVPSPAATPKP
jgi:peptidyl-prolyl cis-trans isomerase A (cyclophilin A)